jgi:transcription antitermination factor NusG
MKSTLAPTSEIKKWRAIYTKSRSEKKVLDQLKQLGYEVFLPMKTELRQWSDRKKKVRTPLIKSYVFIKVSRKELSDVLGIPGVVAVLKYLGKPALIQDHEIENLKIACNGNDVFVVHQNLDLSKGTLVRVVKGAFQGVAATFLEERGKHRVLLHISALNQSIELTVPRSHLEVCQSETKALTT